MPQGGSRPPLPGSARSHGLDGNRSARIFLPGMTSGFPGQPWRIPGRCEGSLASPATAWKIPRACTKDPGAAGDHGRRVSPRGPGPCRRQRRVRPGGGRGGYMPMSRSRDLCIGSAVRSSWDWQGVPCLLSSTGPIPRSGLPASGPACSRPALRSRALPSRSRRARRPARFPRPRPGAVSRSMPSRRPCPRPSPRSGPTPRSIVSDARVT